MAATDTVVPKSAKESMPLPFHETAIPRVHAQKGMKYTTADW